MIIDLRGYFYSSLSDPSFEKAVLTCPAGVAAAVATHWVTAISMATVTALTTLQAIGAILRKTMRHKSCMVYKVHGLKCGTQFRKNNSNRKNIKKEFKKAMFWMKGTAFKKDPFWEVFYVKYTTDCASQIVMQRVPKLQGPNRKSLFIFSEGLRTNQKGPVWGSEAMLWLLEDQYLSNVPMSYKVHKTPDTSLTAPRDLLEHTQG